MNESAKKQLLQSGVFAGLVLALFLILSAFVVLGRKNWENGLRSAVEQVLPASEWQCGKMIPIDSNFSVSAACFELVNKKSPSKKSFALIMRIATHLGPQPAVFVCQDGKTAFCGAAYFNSSLAKEFERSKFSRQLDYWTQIADSLINKAAQAEESK